MRSFLLACLAIAVIAIVAAEILNAVQEPASAAFATSAVRL
jgi:hypothetical protein